MGRAWKWLSGAETVLLFFLSSAYSLLLCFAAASFGYIAGYCSFGYTITSSAAADHKSAQCILCADHNSAQSMLCAVIATVALCGAYNIFRSTLLYSHSVYCECLHVGVFRTDMGTASLAW
jgi:hypothetical protein